MNHCQIVGRKYDVSPILYPTPIPRIAMDDEHCRRFVQQQQHKSALNIWYSGSEHPAGPREQTGTNPLLLFRIIMDPA